VFKVWGEEGVLSQIDVIAFHPFYNASLLIQMIITFPEEFLSLEVMKKDTA